MSNFLKFNRVSFKFPPSTFPHIKFHFSAGEAKPAPPIGPIIAMFQLNMAQVCKDLNEFSKSYAIGLPVGAKIFRSGPKSYQVIISPPTLTFLFENALLTAIPEAAVTAHIKSGEDTPEFSVPDTLSIEMLFNLVRVYASLHNIDSLPAAASSVLSTLKSRRGYLIKTITF